MQIENYINTFNKGMTLDVNVIYQPDGTYRYLKNCQIISQDGNNWVIKYALGNTRTFTINIPFVSYNSGTGLATYAPYPMVIGFISFVDKLVIFSTHIDSEGGGFGAIGVIQYNNYGEGIQPKANSPTNTYSGYVPYYCHEELKFTIQKQIEGFAFDESEFKQRVYWTDHLNEPRVIDIGDPIFTTYYTDGNLIPGQQFMVVEGALTHGGNDYGPGLPNGNVFTAGGVNYTDLIGGNITTTAKVIKYYPYQLLDFQPTRSLGTIKFKEFVAGSVYCGSKMYFYRLADPVNGLYTSWSYGSAPVQVGTENSVPSAPSNAFFDYVGGGNTTSLQNSGRAVRLDISNIDTNFKRIQVACAEYDQALDVPRIISIVIDDVITGTDMVVEHTGNTNLGELSINDITLFPATILKCKTMTTNKGYALIGNLEERNELEFDTTGITLAEITNRFAVHKKDTFGGGTTSCANVLTYENLSPNIGANPAFIIWGHQYIVMDVSGGNVVYDGDSYGLGEVFTGRAGEPSVTIPAGSQLRYCTYRNRYTTNASLPVPEVIGFYPGEDFWTYKNPAMAHHKLGYWANEKYRFGIMFYDLKGNPYYVRWIGDFTFSDVHTVKVIEGNTTASYDYWFLNQRGLKVSGITIPAADIDKISGFSIVRAERDKKIITEGMLMQCGGSGTQIKAAAGPERATNEFGTTVDKYYVYICPDALVGFPMADYAKGAKLDGGFFLNAPVYGSTGGPPVYANMKAVDVDYQMETRWFEQLADDNISRNSEVLEMVTLNEGDVQNGFGSGSYLFYNTVGVGAVVSPTWVDESCVGGGGISNFTDSGAVGGRRTVLEIKDAILGYSSGNSYADLNLASNAVKLVIDTVVEKSNQYGGASETALANTLYITTGHFQPITPQVKADTLDVNGNYTFNDVEIWGGDCYTNLITYGYALYDSTLIGAYAQSYSWGIKFPCQSNVNWDLRRGRTVAGNKMYKGIADNGVYYRVGTSSQFESFDYNEAYSSQGIAFRYPALPADFRYENLFKYRVRFGGEKLPNETINSFRVFFPLDYKDLDGQGGEINNIRAKDGRVIVWQNAITSSVPVLERQLLAADSGAPTTLGTGGVVDRYDPLTSYFGNQHQHGLIQTEYGFAWFDMRRKAFMVMDMGGGIIEVSQVEGLKSFFDEVIIDNLGVYNQSQPLNSPTFSETSDRPLAGVGITGVYDPKFKMTYMTFKFRQHPESSSAVKVNKDFTIGYYHPGKMFVGFFDWTPAIAHNHNQVVFSVNNPKNKTKYYGTGMSSTNFVVGEIVAYENSEWICIQNVTIVSYRGNATLEPGSAGGAYWTKINQTNEIWTHNQPKLLGQGTAPDYLYNSFFGQVVDNEIEFIINPKVANPFNVQNIEQVGNNVYPTSIEISAESQSATETISATSNNYRYIWDRICSNLPFSSTGRIVNNYLRVRLKKKNWTGSQPTVVTGSVKILQLVKSFFAQKR